MSPPSALYDLWTPGSGGSVSPYSDGGEVGTCSGPPRPITPGRFPAPGVLKGGGVVLIHGIYENQTSTSPVATSGPPRGSHCPRGGGSRADSSGLLVVDAGRQGVHALYAPLRRPLTGHPPPPAALPGPPLRTPGTLPRRGYSRTWPGAGSVRRGSRGLSPQTKQQQSCS